MLERGQVDLVFGPESLAEPVDGLNFEAFIDDGVGVMYRSGHPLAKRKRIMASDLEAQVWLAHSRASLLRQQTEAATISSGVRSMQIGCEMDFIRSVLEIVSKTDPIATMPKATTAPYLEDRSILLTFDQPQFHRLLGATRRANSMSGRIEYRFLRMLLQRVGGF